MDLSLREFWNLPAAQVLQELETTAQGLSKNEARRRLIQFGPNLLKPKKKTDSLTLLLTQFKSPIILILMFAAGLSFILHDPVDGAIILSIILVSGLLGFWQERGAANAVDKLLAMVQIKASALRDGLAAEIPIEEIVPGEVVLLKAGDSVPGDGLILESKDLFVDEAALTGETYPVEKAANALAADTPISRRTNSLFMGTHVVSCSAKG